MPISERMLEKIKNAPHTKTVGLDTARRDLNNMAKRIPKAEFSGLVTERVIVTSIRKTLVRIYAPQNTGVKLPVVVYMHGGGFVTGDLELMDGVCRMLAKNAECVVVSVDYGLAPEYKFPGALEECYEVVKWVHENATQIGGNPTNIAVAGDSAGANLSASICLLAKKRKEFTLVYQVLFYPVVDFTIDQATKFAGIPEIMLNSEDLKWFEELYFTDREVEAKMPEASPLLADSLEGLPPAAVFTAGIDPLGKEAIRYAGRLAMEKVAVIHIHYPNMIHGFVGYVGNVAEADEAVLVAARQLRKAFGK
ncbi:MAG: esterase/lipase [Firmicutes bacterium]|nr:esterase/lipase [Bacillota bacterium]